MSLLYWRRTGGLSGRRRFCLCSCGGVLPPWHITSLLSAWRRAALADLPVAGAGVNGGRISGVFERSCLLLSWTNMGTMCLSAAGLWRQHAGCWRCRAPACALPRAAAGAASPLRTPRAGADAASMPGESALRTVGADIALALYLCQAGTVGSRAFVSTIMYISG